MRQKKKHGIINSRVKMIAKLFNEDLEISMNELFDIFNTFIIDFKKAKEYMTKKKQQETCIKASPRRNKSNKSPVKENHDNVIRQLGEADSFRKRQ